MSFNTQQQIELRVQKGIRQAEEELVTWIQDALDKTEYGRPGERDKLEESQFRNLIRVAETTDSPEVIKNFLRYQVGRGSKWGRGSGSLAERIITDIQSKLHETARTIATKAESGDTNKIWIELIRRYLGYGGRYLTYLNKGRQELKP